MIITHGDLDGLASALVAMEISGQELKDVRFFSYEPDRDEKWEKLLSGTKDDVWFVDISLRPDELDWARITGFDEDSYAGAATIEMGEWVWVDHHKTSLDFDPEGIFDEVHLDTSGGKCAADILIEMLSFEKSKYNQHTFDTRKQHLSKWVEVAHDRDLWINKDSERNIKLDMILKAHLKRGRERELLGYCQTAMWPAIIDQFQPYWQDGMKAFDNSCKTAQATSTVVMMSPPNIPITIAWITGQGSDVADTLYETDDEIIVMLQLFPENVGISFRTKRDDIDLSQVAKAFGGGGHPQAAGGKLEHRHLMEGYSIIVADIITEIENSIAGK